MCVTRRMIGAKGFTMIELIIVVVVIAVLISISLPLFTVDRNRARVREAALMVSEILTFAKWQAAKRNRAYEVNIKLNGDGNAIEFINVRESATTNCCFDSTSVLVKTVQFDEIYPGINLRSVFPEGFVGFSDTGEGGECNDAAHPTFCFKPDGRLLDSGTSKPVTAAYGKEATYMYEGESFQLEGGDVLYVLELKSDMGIAASIANVRVSYNGRIDVTLGAGK